MLREGDRDDTDPRVNPEMAEDWILMTCDEGSTTAACWTARTRTEECASSVL
ncbi:hypothetical protein ACFL4G_09990 [Thermodesulfobacteriota bacterium]